MGVGRRSWLARRWLHVIVSRDATQAKQQLLALVYGCPAAVLRAMMYESFQSSALYLHRHHDKMWLVRASRHSEARVNLHSNIVTLVGPATLDHYAYRYQQLGVHEGPRRPKLLQGPRCFHSLSTSRETVVSTASSLGSLYVLHVQHCSPVICARIQGW